MASMPVPSSSSTVLAPLRLRSRRTWGGSIGVRLARSMTRKASSSTAAAAKEARVPESVQPLVAPRVRAGEVVRADAQAGGGRAGHVEPAVLGVAGDEDAGAGQHCDGDGGVDEQ